jgi:hypothetical protein
VSDLDPLAGFAASIEKAPDDAQQNLRRAHSWATELAEEGLAAPRARLNDSYGQWSLTLELPGRNVGIATIWNDHSQPSISLSESVLADEAPGSLGAINAAVSPDRVKHNRAFRSFSEEFFDAVSAAYREAASNRAGDQPSASWDIRVGVGIRRTVVHDRFGGSRQGGTIPSRTTPNIMLFKDPKVGQSHGSFDGWVGKHFYYTGHGQSGDQNLKAGNAAVLAHHQSQKALRVFRGVGGTVTYLGEFEIDESDPFFGMEAPASETGEPRQVIVFRLLPVGNVLRERVDDLVLPGDLSPSELDAQVSQGAASPMIREADVEQQHTEETTVAHTATSHVAVRREQRLVLWPLHRVWSRPGGSVAGPSPRGSRAAFIRRLPVRNLAGGFRFRRQRRRTVRLARSCQSLPKTAAAPSATGADRLVCV